MARKQGSNLSAEAQAFGLKVYAHNDDPRGPYYWVCPCGDRGRFRALLSRAQLEAEQHYRCMHPAVLQAEAAAPEALTPGEIGAALESLAGQWRANVARLVSAGATREQAETAVAESATRAFFGQQAEG
jgi:hypothetical protein